jgi:hypothetical protein
MVSNPRVGVTKVEELSARIRPMLAGNDPAIQSAVIADLLAMWIAGHHPELRDELFTQHIALVRRLVPVCEAQIFGPGGHPGRLGRAQ